MILETIHSPADVRALGKEQLPQLCEELRAFLVNNVSRTGGHLASNLGVVELTVAIHRVFDTASDRLVFDVGHQCYTHKILTGRSCFLPSASSADCPVSPSPTRASMTLSSQAMLPTLYRLLLEWQGRELYKEKITVFWRLSVMALLPEDWLMRA